jgi:ABC-2 type transport system permease protein
LIPMWLLSGAVFPAKNASFLLKAVIMVNPLTYGLAAVRWCMYGPTVGSTMDLPPFALSVAITVAFGLTMFIVSLVMTRRPA